MSARREQILDVAERVLEDVGADRFGIGELARALDIKPPSLYKHFRGLDAIVHALISRGFVRLGVALEGADGLAGFAEVYRAQALVAPQLYCLMTQHPLDRSQLEPGAEERAMRALLDLFGESVQDHPRARAAWAFAHGLVALEIAQRFPPGADPGPSWAVLVSSLAPRHASPAG
ncbi:TetR/AcrR family transcriptional regulator [Microbacterium esteraromaticum]|uniref:TetR/AcrR family transcriptional regulator n=1 Tax=Microbacterium esteraromaticum TaxID=57043 RepID=UPI001A903C67|nr:TetR/AcrR family transcriptional regulator [Microbacterium esteraromaticum]MBN8423945.1 TetR/AcrR family transcriptional regulator [Microbacterium esteraromaticum]